MPINYSLNSHYPESILIRKFEGQVELRDILNSWNYMMKNNLLTNRVIGIINDLRDCELKMNMDNFELLINFLKSNSRFTSIKLAVISNNPEVVKFPSFAEKFVPELSIKPFTTEEAAVHWIEMNI